MPTITVRDQDGKELFTTTPQQGLGKYLKDATAVRSTVSLALAMARPVSAIEGGRATELILDKDVPVGAASELSISAGARVSVNAHQSGTRIFDGSDLQAPVTVPDGRAYASLTLEALLKADLAGTSGPLSFGFTGGTALRYGYFQPFDNAAAPTLQQALATMFSAAVFPADVDDLVRLPVDAYASVSGEGEITFKGSAALSPATNLLATPGLPIVGTVALTGAASVSVAAAWTATGEFEMRVSKPDASRVRLSFFRRRGRSLTVSARATAGMSAVVKGKDLLSMLMTGISKNPAADVDALTSSGLDAAAIKAIEDAVSASIDRSLTLAAQLQLSALSEHDALVAYEIDVARLGSADTAPINDALHGRLASLDALVDQPGSAVRIISHVIRQMRERKTSWRINLLGALNVSSLVDLMRDGATTFDPISGALTAADKVSARRIRVTERPLESDSQKLSRVILESLMVTAAYQASRALGASVSLSAEQVYVEQHGRTSRHDLEDHYLALIALGLSTPEERDARLGALTDFGRSTLTIQNRFDAAACDALFLDAAGQPRPVGEFERIARLALAALLPVDDPVRAFRRTPLMSDALWARIRGLGSDDLAVLPDQVRHDPRKLALIQGDIVTIKWWARAMHTAAVALVEMRTFLGAQDASTLRTNDDFKKKRDELSRALGGVVATTDARFDDPWHVIAMDAAAQRKGALEAVILTTAFAARYDDGSAARTLNGAAPTPESAAISLPHGIAEAT
jgi:hypothetical protein